MPAYQLVAHPDQGGSAREKRRVEAARDALLGGDD